MRCLRFLQRSRFFQLPFLENARDMPRDRRDIPSKQLRNLGLCHPEAFTLIIYLDMRARAVAVDQEAIAGFLILM